MPDWQEVGHWLVEEARERKREAREIRDWLYRLDKRQFVLWGALVAAGGLGVYWLQLQIKSLSSAGAPPAGVTQTITPAGRLDHIRVAWRSAATPGKPCPSVSDLNAALPQLRGIDARERDYVALLLGVRC